MPKILPVRPQCPRCESYYTYYLTRKKLNRCRKCGHEFVFKPSTPGETKSK